MCEVGEAEGAARVEDTSRRASGTSPTKRRRTAVTLAVPRCGNCDALPSVGCLLDLCTGCCSRAGNSGKAGTCTFHKETDTVLLDWAENTKARQELRRVTRKTRSHGDRVPEAALECYGDSATLFHIGDFAASKTTQAWKEPNTSKTATRGWREGDTAVVQRRRIHSRQQLMKAFLEKACSENQQISEETNVKVEETSRTPEKSEAVMVENSNVDNNNSNVDDNKVNDNNVDDNKVDESNVDESKIDESKVDESKVDESKVDESNVDESKVDESNIDESNIDESKVDDNNVDGNKDAARKSTMETPVEGNTLETGKYQDAEVAALAEPATEAKPDAESEKSGNIDRSEPSIKEAINTQGSSEDSSLATNVA